MNGGPNGTPRPLSPTERLMLKWELARHEIVRTLARTAPEMLKQAERMDAIDSGEADPDPGQDEEFVDELERRLREEGEL